MSYPPTSHASLCRKAWTDGYYMLGCRQASHLRLLWAWGLLDNRPLLRCLHGTGLSQWRLGDVHTAKAIFTKLLWLNPTDNQGAHFNLTAVEAGKDLGRIGMRRRMTAAAQRLMDRAEVPLDDAR